jgi:hypothetical protein
VARGAVGALLAVAVAVAVAALVADTSAVDPVAVNHGDLLCEVHGEDIYMHIWCDAQPPEPKHRRQGPKDVAVMVMELQPCQPQHRHFVNPPRSCARVLVAAVVQGRLIAALLLALGAHSPVCGGVRSAIHDSTKSHEVRGASFSSIYMMRSKFHSSLGVHVFSVVKLLTRY